MTVRDVPAPLLEEIKNSLDITWADTATDQKIRNYIRSGMVYLDGKLGADGDYLSDGDPRTLLFEFVRYARDGAMDIFEHNYQSMILAMQNKKVVRDYAKDADSAK